MASRYGLDEYDGGYGGYIDPQTATFQEQHPETQQPEQAQVGGAGWTPRSKAELVAYAAQRGWSEDFARFPEQQVMQWVSENWNPQAGAFNSEKRDKAGNPLPGTVEKPVDTPEGWSAWGDYAIPTAEAQARQAQWGAPAQPAIQTGGIDPAPGMAANVPASNVPTFQYEPFKPPTQEEVMADPGVQFRLGQGVNALERSASAKGTLRNGGTLKDIIGFGQDLGSQEYGNAYNRAFQGWQGNLGAAQAKFNSEYQPWAAQFGAGENRWQTGQNNALSRWQTEYGGNLSKYLNKENNIYGLLNTPPPQFPSYGG
jgi:hypothetical protein